MSPPKKDEETTAPDATDATADDATATEAKADAKGTKDADEKSPELDLATLIANLSPDKIVEIKTSLGIRDDSTPAPEPSPVQPLHVVASNYPLAVEATTALKGADVAKKLDVKLDELLAFSVRCPLNIDGEPIGEKGVLTGVLANGSKTAIEFAI